MSDKCPICPKKEKQKETAWLTQAHLAELFQTSRPNITMHIKNILEEGELQEVSVCKDFLHTAADGKNYNTKYYKNALGQREKREKNVENKII